MINDIQKKLKTTAILFGAIYIPMWAVFLITNIIPGNAIKLFFGVQPRTFSWTQPFAIVGSWLPHVSYTHIINNSIMLFALLLSVCLIERRPIRLTAILIAFSGLLTWLLGSNHSLHVGASGLVFALFGYICSSLVLSRKWAYLIPIIFFSLYYGVSYFTSMLGGLIPNQYISFAAHFGGLVSGIITGFFYERIKKQKI